VNENDRFWHMVRWYPPQWRARFGDEMAALLEDTHGMSAVPLRDRISLAKSGSMERVREAGLIGDSTGPDERIRAGSLLVLCGWSLFIVAGGIFAKFTEHWGAVTPKVDRLLLNDGYNAVRLAGEVGMALVLAAAFVVLPAFIRLVRGGGWARIKRPILRAALTGSATVAITAGGIVWAHQLSYHDRNGGSVPYEVVFLIWGLAVVASIATSTAAAVCVTRIVNLSERTLRGLSGISIAVTLMMAVTIVGMVTWWGTEAIYAPQFLRNGFGNGIVVTSGTAPPALVSAGVLMVLGLAIAAFGALHAARSLPADIKRSQLDGGSQ
jgi:hypothetical protein